MSYSKMEKKEDNTSESTLEEFTQHSCNPCLHEGLLRSASYICSECEEELCRSCEIVHRKLKISRHHNIEPVDESGISPESSPQLQVAYCEDHTDHVISEFCDNHGVLVCGLCRVSSHSSCNIAAISDVAKEKDLEMETIVTFDDADLLQKELNQFKASRESDLLQIKDQSGQFITDVHCMKKQLVDSLDELENNSVSKIKVAEKITSREITSHVTLIKLFIRNLEEQKKIMKQCQDTKNTELLAIGVIKAEKQIEEIKRKLTKLKKDKIVSDLHFIQKKDLLKAIEQSENFGTVPLDIAEGCSNIHALFAGDIHVPDAKLTGCTFMSNGDLILCDTHHNMIFIYDPNFESKTHFKLSSHPWDISAIDENSVLVTLPSMKEIQSLAVEAMTEPKTFRKLEQKCWGIFVYQDMVYVTCHDGERGGDIFVFNKTGEAVRKIGHEVLGRHGVQGPYYISVSTDRIFVTDFRESSLTCLNQDGEKLYRFTSSEFKKAEKMTVDGEGHVFICGRDSNTIHLISENGDEDGILLSAKDGLNSPYCLSYREKDGVLVVGMSKPPECKVFILKRRHLPRRHRPV